MRSTRCWSNAGSRPARPSRRKIRSLTDTDKRPSRRGLLHDRLRLPVIAAPMFLVSGPEMVIGASRAGVAGSFPAANCRTSDELDAWLPAITAAIGNSDRAVEGSAPWGIHLVAHRLNKRLSAHLELPVLDWKRTRLN